LYKKFRLFEHKIRNKNKNRTEEDLCPWTPWCLLMWKASCCVQSTNTFSLQKALFFENYKRHCYVYCLVKANACG